MPTTALDEKVIRDALTDLKKATANCTKDELHYLWRRDVLPTHIYTWLRKERKDDDVPTPGAG